jgi:mono/diheme cytochrome c family protein
MRRPLLVLAIALAVVGAFTGGLAWLLNDPTPPPGAPRAQRLYLRFCAECHGTDGRGSWRATMFFLRPGDLTDPARLANVSDRYLFDVIKHGGAPIGRPGMPAFGAQLSDSDIEGLVAYVRSLSARRARPARRLRKKAHLRRWRPRPHAQRTGSTPRVRPSGAA